MNIQVQLVTWNSKKHLNGFFASLKKQTLKPACVVCIDNASTDGTKEFLREQPISTIFLDKNTGFGHAHNLGFQEAKKRGKIDAVLICNTDIILDENCLKNLAKAMEIHPNAGTLSGVLLRMSTLTKGNKISIIDSAGIQKRFGFRFTNRGEGKRFTDAYTHDAEVFANSGACMLIPFRALEKIGMKGGTMEFFDDAFFAYKEDIDVGWMMQERGFTNMCIGKAIGYHERHVKKGWGYQKKSERIVELSYKNHLYLLKKHYSFDKDPFGLIGICIVETFKLLSIAIFHRQYYPFAIAELRKIISSISLK